MKLPVPKTLADAFSPTVAINLFFAIAVIHYPQNKRRPILSALWAITHVIVYVLFLQMADLMALKQFMGSAIAASNYRFNGYFQTIFISVSMFLSQYKEQVITKILLKAIAIDERLRVLGVPNDYELVLKAQIMRHSVAFSYLFVVIVLDFFYVGLDYHSETARVGFLLFAHYFLVFDYVIDASYTNSVSYFRNRFQRLNSLLAETKLQSTKKVQQTQKSNYQYSQKNSWMYNEILENALSIRPTSNQWLLYVTKEIRTIHRDLCKTTMELNQVYATQVLFSITLSFGLITALLYTAYDLAADDLSPSLFDTVMTKTVSAMWLIYYIAKVVWLISTCAATSIEAMRTGALIQDLADSTSIYSGDIRDEVSVFTLQLIQNPLYFTAAGFFTVDYGLLQKATRSAFRKLITINARLKTLGIPNDYALVYKAQITELFIGLSLMVVIQILDYIYIGPDYPGKFARISFLTATHYCIVFTFILDITYNTSIRYFGNRFRRLKTFLAELHLENRGQDSAQLNRLADNQRILHIAKVVRKLHGDLCTTAMELNQVFGLQVLLSIALSFGILTALLYTGYTLAADLPKTSILDDMMIKMAAGLWIGFYVVKITRIAAGCAGTTTEAKQSGDLIQDVLEMAAIYNRDIRDEINILSLQLIQNRLCFTAKGFFTLDYALLSKALSFGGWCLVIRKPRDNGETLNTERYHCDNGRWQWPLVEAAA
ncbi:uncharacterized protein LOC124308489 [Neodiprion virginianus]|uniref:uncharacterized protein LOC124308489 n=1 Tax=Neodiprion virginianus TaxID=2961670 RepID=UPI001EE69EC7|nr:uncharacterized protein LOC124308489 [Neodiprion virginianus]